MPVFIGAWMEMLNQIRDGRRLDNQIGHLRQWQIAEPLSLVPRSRRARALLCLQQAEYLSMLGRSGIRAEDLIAQEERIMDATQKAEEEARTALEQDRERLAEQGASKLDVAQLAVDLLAMGRTWTAHFNQWSATQEEALRTTRERSESEVARIESEVRATKAELAQRLDQLQSAIEEILSRLSVDK